jgi:hypothetical protein
MVTELAQRANPVVLAEWCAPRLEKWLGGEHQDA